MGPLVVALVAFAACAPLPSLSERAPRVRGPLPTRVQHPLALTLPNLTPRRALVQPQGQWGVGVNLAYASIFERASRNGELVDFDAEVLRASARVRYGFASAWDVDLEFGGVYTSGGFLDGFIQDFHDFIGAPNQGREKVEDDRFSARIVRDGTAAYVLDPHEALLGDTAVVFTRGETDVAPGEWANAWRAGLELPTGDEDAGAGNGGVDWIVGWSGEISFRRFSHFAAASYGHGETPDRLRAADIELEDRASLFYALEYRATKAASFVAQLDLQSPLVRDVDLDEIDKPIVDLGLGVAWDTGPDSGLWCSFQEDVASDSGPDFAVLLGWRWRR